MSPDRGMASVALTDVSYSFDATKVENSKNSFHFVRSFVDYFYLILKANQDELYITKNFSKFAGLCVGDAHAENFGFLVQQNGASKFTVNDFDDFGPCPVAYDLYRFMMSSTLYDSTLDVGRVFDMYMKGLMGEQVAPPPVIQNMLATSQSRGDSISPKKLTGSNLVRDDLTSEVTPQVREAVRVALLGFAPSSRILDIVKTMKEGGGSAGMVRYQVLANIGGQVRYLEFKEQTQASVYPVATAPLLDAKSKIFTAIRMEQGSQASKLYGYAQVLGADMLIRPIFWGSVGVSLGSSQDDDFDAIYFEAYTLGQIHRQSVTDLNGYIKALQTHDIEGWKSDVNTMAHFMSKKYKAVRSN
ncbi:MAG: DUF2252 family protein [Bdellovibrionales bacterium]|nr:DUF2252 family protein [Bdellovibrionales bacterium]